MTARRAFLAAVLAALAAAAVARATNRAEVLGPLADETLLLPIALRTTGLASFAGDKWLDATAPVFSVPYSWIAGLLLRLIDDPVAALAVLSFPFHVVFLAGTALLAGRAAGPRAALVAVALTFVPPFAAILFVPGAALPRDLVFALLPWFVLGADRFRDDTRRAAFVYAALGAAANLHPLTALHAALFLLLVELVRRPWGDGVRAALVRGLAFAAGAVPYAVQYLARPAAAGAVDATVYAWRLGSMAGETPSEWTMRTEPMIFLALAACVAARGSKAVPRRLALAACVTLAIGLFGPELGAMVPPLRAVQLDRLGRMATWCLAVVLAAGLAELVADGRRRRAALAVAIASAAVLGPLFLADRAGRGPLARVARRLERGTGVPVGRVRPAALAVREGASDPSSPAERDAFLAVCRFAREDTAADALFVVPPENWGAFRAYARRGAVVTRKEGGAALSFLGAAGMRWFEEYAFVVSVYARGHEPAWRQLARNAKAAYVVTDAVTSPPPSWPVVFEAGGYRVLAVSPN